MKQFPISNLPFTPGSSYVWNLFLLSPAIEWALDTCTFLKVNFLRSLYMQIAMIQADFWRLSRMVPFSHLNGHWMSARPLPWRSTKFVAFKSLLVSLKLSSSHPYQPLVLISTAQCITRLRRKRSFAKHSKSRDHHRYIDHGHFDSDYNMSMNSKTRMVSH